MDSRPLLERPRKVLRVRPFCLGVAALAASVALTVSLRSAMAVANGGADGGARGTGTAVALAGSQNVLAREEAVLAPLLSAAGGVFAVVLFLTFFAVFQRRNSTYLLFDEQPPAVLHVCGSQNEHLNGEYNLLSTTGSAAAAKSKDKQYRWEMVVEEPTVTDSNRKTLGEIYVIKKVLGVWTIDKRGDGKVSAQSCRLARGRFPHEAPMIWMSACYDNGGEHLKFIGLFLDKQMEIMAMAAPRDASGQQSGEEKGSGSLVTASSSANMKKEESGTLVGGASSATVGKFSAILGKSSASLGEDGDEEDSQPHWPEDASSIGHPALTAVLAGAALLVGCPLIAIWYVTVKAAAEDSTAFAINVRGQIAALAGHQELVDCGCVLIERLNVVLPSAKIGLWSVLLAFGWNFFSALKEKKCPSVLEAVKGMGHHCSEMRHRGVRHCLPHWLPCSHGSKDGEEEEEEEGEEPKMDTFGDIAWHSVRVPSAFLLSVGALFQLYHFLYLLVVTPKESWGMWYVFYEAVYTNMVNSGGMFFFITSVICSFATLSYVDNELLGFDTAEPYVHAGKPVGLRVIVAGVLVFVCLPCLLTHVFPAMLRWFVLAVPLEVFFALLTEAFFPEAMDTALRQIADWRYLAFRARERHLSERFHDTWHFIVWFVLFPLHEPVAYVVQRFGLTQPASIAGPLTRTVVIAAMCFMKALSVQYFFDLQLMRNSGLDYNDSVVLAYGARHYGCTTCLAGTVDSYAREALNQLLTGTR